MTRELDPSCERFWTPRYENNRGATGVMQMIQNIIDEAAQMEKDALKAETDAQAASRAGTREGALRAAQRIKRRDSDGCHGYDVSC